jgi:hypothetical protein
VRRSRGSGDSLKTQYLVENIVRRVIYGILHAVRDLGWILYTCYRETRTFHVDVYVWSTVDISRDLEWTSYVISGGHHTWFGEDIIRDLGWTLYVNRGGNCTWTGFTLNVFWNGHCKCDLVWTLCVRPGVDAVSDLDRRRHLHTAKSDNPRACDHIRSDQVIKVIKDDIYGRWDFLSDRRKSWATFLHWRPKTASKKLWINNGIGRLEYGISFNVSQNSVTNEAISD